MIRKTCTVAMGFLLSVGVTAGGCADEGAAGDVVTSALTGQVPVAVQGNDNYLWVDQSGPGAGGGPGTATNTFLGMKAGTVPSQAKFSDGVLGLGFQANTGNFFFDTFGMGADNSNLVLAAGTSPSIVIFPDNTVGFSTQGANGKLWISHRGVHSGFDTTTPMAGGASPSMANELFDYAVVFRGTNGHLWYRVNAGDAADTGVVLASGTNPSIAVLPNAHYAIAIQGSNGDLWITMTASISSATDPLAFIDTGLGMKAGTSPAVSGRGSVSVPIANVAFQANTSEMWIFTDTNGAGTAGSSGIAMSNTRSPTIISTGSGFQAACKGANGDLWVDLNGSVQDQRIPMN